MRNKILAAMAALVLLLTGCRAQTPAPSAPPVDKTVFTDSLGRSVELDSQLTRVAPCGSVAQIILYTLAPELMVGWAANPDERARPYIPEQYWQLPTFGQFYGKNVSLNIEALVTAAPQVIIDMGDQKPNMAADLDGVSQQLDLPVVFIDATLESMPQAYRTLGRLLGREQRAEELALYCEEALEMARLLREETGEAGRVSAYYGTGKDGLACNARGSIHAAVLEMVGVENAAVVENVSQKGGGNQVDLEQLLLWNPEVVLLSAQDSYDAVMGDPAWGQLEAVQVGRVYEIPNRPYDLLSSPPSVNRVAGLHWLAWRIYPDRYPGDIRQTLETFYRLFYQYDLSSAELDAML